MLYEQVDMSTIMAAASALLGRTGGGLEEDVVVDDQLTALHQHRVDAVHAQVRHRVERRELNVRLLLQLQQTTHDVKCRLSINMYIDAKDLKFLGQI